MSGKIKKLGALKKTIFRLKKKGKRIVFTNGCFDLLHFGHVACLEKAKGFGDILIVGLNSDSSVRKIKGKPRPFNPQLDRARVLAGLSSVDYVVVFGEKTPFELIRRLKPDVLIKGADWKKDKIVGNRILKSYGGRIATVRLAKGRSTTGLIKKIGRAYAE